VHVLDEQSRRRKAKPSEDFRQRGGMILVTIGQIAFEGTRMPSPMIKPILWAGLLAGVLFPVGEGRSQLKDNAAEPIRFYREFVGLTDEQIRQIHEGRAIAKILDSPTADQVFVFGSVYIHSTPERYLTFASDLNELRKLPSYLAIRQFSSPFQLTDLEEFTVDAADFKELKDCKPGRCKFQLPAERMDEFQRSIDWSAPDAADQVNRLAQKMALQALLDYQQGGNAALGAYRDKSHPAAVAETFASLADRTKGLPVYLPELRDYLLNYPKADSSDIESQFYWEKVNFGLKPTFRMVQAVIYRGKSTAKPVYAVALKQIYASHYFETALDLTVCVKDLQAGDHPGFYLITMKGSQQAGLTGLKGSIVRKVAVDKTRSSLEKALESIKEKLESGPS
jgi:hypothetical protein